MLRSADRTTVQSVDRARPRMVTGGAPGARGCDVAAARAEVIPRTVALVPGMKVRHRDGRLLRLLHRTAPRGSAGQVHAWDIAWRCYVPEPTPGGRSITTMRAVILRRNCSVEPQE